MNQEEIDSEMDGRFRKADKSVIKSLRIGLEAITLRGIPEVSEALIQLEKQRKKLR